MSLRGRKESEMKREYRVAALAFLAEHRRHATTELRDGREFRVVRLPTVHRSRNNPKEET